jgi:photosystem II stability/assembly factor-like uncharacterized protein
MNSAWPRGSLVCATAVVAALLLVSADAPRPRLFPGIGGAHAVDGESWFRLQRGYPTSRLPSPDVLDRAMRTRLPRPGPRPKLALPGDRWISIGPSPIFVQGGLPFAGRITSVAPHPSDANIIYIGTDGAGIWKTTSNGASWTWLTPDLPVAAIASLAIDPVNANLLYATTIHRTYPVRLLRSSDAGATWTASSISERGQPLSPMVCSVNVLKACIPPSSGRLMLDPAHAGSAAASTIYYVGLSHVLQSDDSGQTFRSVFSLPVDLDFGGSNAPARNFEAEYIRDAVIDPSRPDRLFVATATPHCLDATCTRADAAIVVHRIVGGRDTPRTIGTVPGPSFISLRYADPGPVYVMRIRLAISRSNPDVMALALRDERVTRVRVFRSTTAGDEWSETASLGNNSLTWPLDVAFSPADANTIYVASNSVYRTTNGGETWTAFANPHSDNIAIAFTPSGAVLVGGDGGLWTSANGASFTAMHSRLPSITEFYSIASHANSPLLLAGGTQDNGTVTLQGPLGWSLVTGGDGGDVVFDPDPQIPVLYAEIEWFFSAGGQNVFQFFRCQSGGCPTRNTGLDLSLAGPFIPRIVMDPSNAATLYLTVEKIFRTDDRAETWTAVSPSVAASLRCWQDPREGRSCAPGQYFVAAAVAPTASQTIYAGALNGDVWVSASRGATWQSVAGANAGPLPVRAVNDIAVDPLDARTAYVAYSGFDSGGSGTGHVFRTSDGGQTWQDVSAGLPDLPVNTLLIDPDSAVNSTPRVLYAGTDIGVYRVTLDGSGTWEPFGTGLPPVVVNRLAYNRTTRQLLAATYGRGVWAISSRFR